MATFNIPFCKVSYAGRDSVVNEPAFYAYWGATVTGEYLDNPYRLRITKVTLNHRWKCNGLSGTGLTAYFFAKPSQYRVTIYSYKGTSSSYKSVSFTMTATGDGGGYCHPGDVFNTGGTWTGTKDLELHPDGGKLRAACFEDGDDHGMIYSSEYYPSDYVPVNPDLNVSFGSDNVNDIKVVLNSSVTTDLSSYTYTINIYSDSGRTQLVKQFHASNLNGFPLHWNGAVPGTTYYWSIDMSGTNSKTGGTVSMPQKTGTMTTMKPDIAKEAFTLVSASPLFNGHWTPRTVITFNITGHGTTEHATGLTFKDFQIITALNGLYSNEKEYRSTVNNGANQTLVLTDTSKVSRAVKPRDLFYLKIRVCCVDNAGREYFSDTFGILTPQYIYNWYHVYLAQPSSSEQLRVNSKVAFAGKTSENYWNKGEVK